MNFQSCCAIAPASGEFKPVPYLNITVKEAVELEYYTSQKLLLVDNSEVEQLDATIRQSFHLQLFAQRDTIIYFVVETLERTICYYIMFNGMETGEESTTTAGYDDGDFLASCGKNRERRWTHCHAVPVKIKILLFQKAKRMFAIIQPSRFFSRMKNVILCLLYFFISKQIIIR